MTTSADEFVRDGMVVVEGALDPAFCEDVIARRLRMLGVVEADRRTWPRGWRNLPATITYPLEDVAPAAATVLHEIVGGRDALGFHDLPDNLILNFPDPDATWWAPGDGGAPQAGWHKDGDWFRHFLDSPEQGLLGIVFWRDVDEEQGATYIVADSIPAVARLLERHPEGIAPPVDVREIVAASRDRRALTGRQGTIVWAHPFLVHSGSVNATDRIRIISNTAVTLRRPPVFCGPGPRTPLERVVLGALGVDELRFRITGARARIVSERERHWAEQQAAGADTRL
jgi:hypothetical protein